MLNAPAADPPAATRLPAQVLIARRRPRGLAQIPAPTAGPLAAIPSAPAAGPVAANPDRAGIAALFMRNDS